MSEKRKDSKGRVLQTGERQRKPIIDDDTPKVMALTKEQVESLFSIFKNDSILIGAGMRISEFAALTIKETDFANNVIHANKQIVRLVAGYSDDKGGSDERQAAPDEASCHQKGCYDRWPPWILVRDPGMTVQEPMLNMRMQFGSLLRDILKFPTSKLADVPTCFAAHLQYELYCSKYECEICTAFDGTFRCQHHVEYPHG